MVALKPDAHEIRSFLTDLAQQSWVKRSERHTWPLFVYHYTDITNAVQILRDGRLYSRRQIETTGRSIVDCASSAVLAGTDDRVKDCVRFYFRPKTPTQYYAEGIHSKITLRQSSFPDAHRPVPVFFLFNSAAVLTRQNVEFSDGGLGNRRARVLSTATELKGLPWKRIYHNGSFPPSSREDIVFRRNAEVIVPTSIGLRTLRYIYCRSEAEKDTLLHMFAPDLRQQYGRKVVATPRSEHYFRQRTFVQKARLSSDTVRLDFSPETRSPGPFHARVELDAAGRQRSLEIRDFELARLPQSHTWRLGLRPAASSYEIRVFLDNHLAYANRYKEEDLPF